MDPSNVEYGRGKRHHTMAVESMRLAEEQESGEIESAFLVLADDEPENYDQAMKSVDGDKWKVACQKEIDTLQGYNT